MKSSIDANNNCIFPVVDPSFNSDLVVRSLPSPASSDKTPGEAVDAQPSPPSSDEAPREAVEAPPSPTSSDETPGDVVNAKRGNFAFSLHNGSKTQD